MARSRPSIQPTVLEPLMDGEHVEVNDEDMDLDIDPATTFEEVTSEFTRDPLRDAEPKANIWKSLVPSLRKVSECLCFRLGINDMLT